MEKSRIQKYKNTKWGGQGRGVDLGRAGEGMNVIKTKCMILSNN